MRFFLIKNTEGLHGIVVVGFCCWYGHRGGVIDGLRFSIFFTKLFLSAGSVLYDGRRDFEWGLFQSMPLDDLWCDRAFAISAFPFTSGFVTKSMVSYAAADEHLFYVWLGLVVVECFSSCWN